MPAVIQHLIERLTRFVSIVKSLIAPVRLTALIIDADCSLLGQALSAR